MMSYVQSFLNIISLRFKKIQTKGRIFLSLHSTSKIAVEQKLVYGVSTLGNMSRPLIESILVMDEKSILKVNSAAIGRGARIKLFSGAHLYIGKNSYISDNCFLSISTSLSIGNDCAISWDVQIFDNDGHIFNDQPSKSPIVIGDRVWIGCGVTILKGTEIADGCVVAAGAVVSGKFPPNSLIGGVPAKVIREGVSWK